MESVFECFRRNRNERPREAAFLIAAGDRSVPITWAEFAADIEATAWVVKKYSPGGTVGFLGENSYEWITGHAACVFSGAVAVPLDPSLSVSEIADMMKFVGAGALVHSSLCSEKAAQVGKLVPGLIVRAFGSKVSEMFVDQGRKALAAGEKGVFDLPPPDESAVSMIMFTSGTTSRSRGAELTMLGLSVFREYWASQLKISPGDRSLMVLPLHHIFGLCVCYMMLCEGGVLGVCPNFRRLYDAVERFRAGKLFLVPALADMLAAKIEHHASSAEAAFGTRLEWIVTGGAPLPRRTYERLSALGVHVMTAYGLTETTALYSVATSGDDPRIGSAGRACDIAGTEVRVSRSGELLIRGPGVFKGYHRDPVRTAAVLDDDGWFNTGDIGRVDEDGFVWITGRASRTIVLSSGKKVSPEELEERILSLPGIREVSIRGDGDTREISAEIFAVVSEDSVRREIDALNASLPLYKRINRVTVRETPFPRTSSGKIRLQRQSSRPQDVLGAVDRIPEESGGNVRGKKVSMKWMLVFSGFAVIIAVMEVLIRYEVKMPEAVRSVFTFADVALEFLLVLAILFFLLKGRSRNR